MSSAAERAGRLGASLLLFGIVREPAPAAIDGASASGLLSAAEWKAWRETDDEDTALALACLAAEHELRARQFDCLEFLLHVSSTPDVKLPPEGGRVTGASGAPAAPMVVVSRAQAEAVALTALGWDLAPPAEVDA